MRIIIAITGATGAPLAIRVLEALATMPEVETHLVMSKWARSTIELETELRWQEVAALADQTHEPGDQGAKISSGSFKTDGMIIVPCSMKTLAGIRTGYAEDLITRAADVVIKEQRKLVLVPRETPLSPIHLDNMAALSHMGVQFMPPVLTFYNHPETIDNMLDHLATRILDQFGLSYERARRWDGIAAARATRPRMS